MDNKFNSIDEIIEYDRVVEFERDCKMFVASRCDDYRQAPIYVESDYGEKYWFCRCIVIENAIVVWRWTILYNTETHERKYKCNLI